jgi:hypothetical protein
MSETIISGIVETESVIRAKRPFAGTHRDVPQNSSKDARDRQKFRIRCVSSQECDSGGGIIDGCDNGNDIALRTESALARRDECCKVKLDEGREL